MGANAPGVEALCDCPRSRIEREREGVPPQYSRSPDVDAPFAAHHPVEVVDNGTITRKLGGPLIDEAHTIHPYLLRFGDRRALDSNPAEVLKEFGNIAMRGRAAGPGWSRGCPARHPLPTTLRGRIATAVLHRNL